MNGTIVEEELPDPALRRPVGHRDRPARPAHAHELVGDDLVARREHRAERRQHHVERRVLERQRLGVGLDPLEPQPEPLGPRAPGRQQLGRQVGRDDVGAGLRGRDRRRAGAGRHVEDALPGADARGGHERGSDLRDRLEGDLREVARRPHRAMAGLELGVRFGHRVTVVPSGRRC